MPKFRPCGGCGRRVSSQGKMCPQCGHNLELDRHGTYMAAGCGIILLFVLLMAVMASVESCL